MRSPLPARVRDREYPRLNSNIYLNLDFHVRNRPGQKQRVAVSGFGSSSKKKPAFHVSCAAKAIIHGLLGKDDANTRATLLVYDFSFFSYRSTRIKEASISFEFHAGKSRGVGPTVKKVAPYAKHIMMPTTETATRNVGGTVGLSGGTVVTANATTTVEKSVTKTTTHAAEIIGDNPFDDWGNSFLAQWSLKENDSQQNGIVVLLRTCILLTRDTDDEFHCIPKIEAEPNFKAWLGTLVSSRTPDDPIILDPEYEPYNTFEEGPYATIDRWNLGRVNMDGLWDCTFHRTFGEAVKVSRIVGAERQDDLATTVETIQTVTEAKAAAP